MLKEFFSDLEFLVNHAYKDQEMAVKRWSIVECDDYQRAIFCLWSVFSRAISNRPPSGRLDINNLPERKAFAEIVLNSHIGDVLKFDSVENCVQLRDDVSRALLDEIFDFIVKRSDVISD